VLAVGHTTKGNPRVAVQPNDYFGSSMLWNFFKELFFIDTTTDGKFFLCHAKTKSKERYNETVPVFTLGEHPVVGVGFNYEALMPLSDIQLPFALQPNNAGIKKRNLRDYKSEVSVLHRSGSSIARIADIFGVSRGTVYNLIDD